MTFDKIGDVAHTVQGQIDDQLKQVTRWMKPYSKKASKKMVRLSHDLRPYGEQCIDAARKHPGKTLFGAVAIGYLLARLTRRR